DPVLSYSTFLGGTAGDDGLAVAVDSFGNAYATGFTASTNFPTTPGAFDTTINAAEDCFVSKLNSAGTALVYSTFIGGNNNTHGNAVAVDAGGNAYVAGVTADAANGLVADSAGNAFVVGDTQSPDLITSLAPPVFFDNTLGGTQDAFVLKVNTRAAGAASLVYATFLGGSGTDGAQAVAIDSAGEDRKSVV